ncbi:MAG: hypothetical protein DRQ42_00485 [Gammaproteobacteria bacterium]|nr:MAG: hypothetical protein DRQ42_00485 [Gammaproteobacteria bacterium]
MSKKELTKAEIVAQLTELGVSFNKKVGIKVLQELLNHELKESGKPTAKPAAKPTPNPAAKPAAKEKEKVPLTAEEIAAVTEKYKRECPSFGIQDLKDAGCNDTCRKAHKAMFEACSEVSKPAKKAPKEKGAGMTIFGHQAKAVSGRIDAAILSGPMTYKEIADLITSEIEGTCTVNRVKAHIEKDLKIGLRTGNVIMAIFDLDKDAKVTCGMIKSNKKAA